MTRVLVVDDDAVSRLVLTSVLRKHGCEVDMAEDVAEALTLLAGASGETGGGYAACFSDYVMPDGTGLDLVDRAEEAGHTVPFVLVTGVVEHVESASLERRLVRRVVQKPLSSRLVAECLEQVVGPLP